MSVLRSARWLLPLVAGVVLLGIGVRRLGLPYENGRHFDETTGTVAHLQTAETLVVVGAVLCAVGLVVLVATLVRSRRAQARSTPSHSSTADPP